LRQPRIHHQLAEQLCGADRGRSWTPTAYASKAENRKQIAEAIAPANYINAPVTVLEQVLTGTYADWPGRREDRRQARRFRSVPLAVLCGVDADPDEALGPDQGDVDYKAVAEQVYLATDTKEGDGRDGADAADDVDTRSFSVMGKTVRSGKPDDYLASFKIRRRREGRAATIYRPVVPANAGTHTPRRQ
jgi:nitrate/nitrite transport system substrate-binding protein